MPSAAVGSRFIASSSPLACHVAKRDSTRPVCSLGKLSHGDGGYGIGKKWQGTLERVPAHAAAERRLRSAFALPMRQGRLAVAPIIPGQSRGSSSIAAAVPKESEGETMTGVGLRPAAEGVADDIQLQCDESGCVIVMNGSASGAKPEDLAEELVCDLSGCYFSEERRGENEFKLVEGSGWRIGYETAPESEDSFCAMVGAGGWSIALTANEYNDMCNLLQSLKKSIATMDQEGDTGRDDIIMEVERGSVWMECSVPKKRLASLQRFWKFGNGSEGSAFEVRFVLSGASGRRQAEGYWPAEAVMDMLKTVEEATRKTTESEMVAASV
eukprot:TRINITY_DN8054_c0_g1_i1.p1 TRINITY_DN8054_c0_g1~~TRINITY_DN8054_c0_g1_i1.p1  ORF type:complete len:327 (-),score=68.85 TRINITY_DN8054_c0_g1_i1:610-1590(-)